MSFNPFEANPKNKVKLFGTEMSVYRNKYSTLRIF